MKKQTNPEKKVNLYIRFTSVAIQMGVIIGGFTWLGTYLDEKQKFKTPIWTIILSLFGVFASMYLIFKELKNINKN
jgi:heme/copper-type cytochrome/quinol oxidase subunit 4